MSEILAESLTSLRTDYKSLKARLKLIPEFPCPGNANVHIHLHYPAFCDGEPIVSELVNSISNFLIQFCLANSKLGSLEQALTNGSINVAEYTLALQNLQREAKTLFIKANKATASSGEAGELLLFILTEWILDAPKILSKMCLKTNSSMAVHGSDAVHCKYSEADKSLFFYFGEAKLYQNVKKAIDRAFESIATSLTSDALEHELLLVENDINVSGLSEAAQKELLKYLDPEDELYNQKKFRITCLIGFDFSKYTGLPAGTAEDTFRTEALAAINSYIPKLEQAIKDNAITKPIDIFFLPLPSVGDFRILFQNEIGWRNP